MGKEATWSSQKNQPFVLNWGDWGMSAMLAYLERFLFYNEKQKRRGTKEETERPKAGLRKREEKGSGEG